MKNIITEELGYMKYLFGYQRGVVISEQVQKMSKAEKNAQDAYKLMIDGAESMGTNPQKIIDGLNKVHTPQELNRLFTLFADKKTGYSSFSDMIRGEFNDRVRGVFDDKKDLEKIVKRLNKFNFNVKSDFEGENFPNLNFTPIKKPLTDVVPAAAAPAKEHVTHSEHWKDIVKYFYEKAKAEDLFFNEKTGENDDYTWDCFDIYTNNTNDKDSYMRVVCNGSVWFYNKGRGTGRSYGTWEWDGTKPVIKFKDISKNASGYVQPTDTDWSAVTEDNKVIGLNAKGPLVKQVQQTLINIGYSGETGNPITTDVQACLDDVENCDGIYGKSTKEMVKQYQKDNGLNVDGVVGQQTYDSMF
jgi:hypothetical protein